jgi:hypothetical protein
MKHTQVDDITTDCECLVEPLDNYRDAVLHYCPVHAAAPVMYRALGKVSHCLREYETIGELNKGLLIQEVLRIAEHARAEVHHAKPS